MEQGLLHVTEPGPPEQSVPSHDPEAAGQPAELEIATTQSTLSEPLPPTWAPRLSRHYRVATSPQGSHGLCTGSPGTDMFRT